MLYVSPLKALVHDVDRNLRAPLQGIALAAQARGEATPAVRVGIRTGDTPADERRAIGKQPPDILVTTPESLYLLLTSAARETLRSVRVADRRRDPRPGRHQARRPPGAVAGAAGGASPTASRSASASRRRSDR